MANVTKDQQSIGNPNIKLAEFLKISRSVTDNYIQAWGKWTESDQWAKIHEEDLEFMKAPNKLNELEEFWDCFFAKLTLLHLQDIDDYAIMASAISTWNKIHSRSIKELQKTKIEQ